MEPAAAEVERMSGYVDRPRAAADPLRGFQQQGGEPTGGQPAGRANPCCPASDDHDVPISSHAACPFAEIVLH